MILMHGDAKFHDQNYLDNAPRKISYVEIQEAFSPEKIAIITGKEDPALPPAGERTPLLITLTKYATFDL